jgi:hypothetical protein
MIVALLCAPCVLAQSAPADPFALQTRDSHQKLLVVADPYVAADRYKGALSKKSPYEAGIMAVDVYFRNDNDAPIRLNLGTIRLEVSLPGEDHQQLEPLLPEEVADRTLLKANTSPKAPRLPIPTARITKSKGKDWSEMVDALKTIALSTDVLPPHASTHGFLFFDMGHHFDAIRYAQVYIPDLAFMTDKSALLFFEIDLGPPAK